MANISGVSGWITINGSHIPLLKGESKAAAYARFKDNIDKKKGSIKGGSINKGLARYRKMSNEELDELSAELRSMNSQELYKLGLNGDSYTQRLVHKLGLNDKPTVVSKEEFEKQSKGQDLLYRGVKGRQDSTAEQFNNVIKNGDTTWIGNGSYGDGLYFSTSKNEAISYSDKSKGSLMTACINKNKAKIITSDDLRDKIISYSEKNNVSAIKRFNGASNFALYNGYNVIKQTFSNGESYYVAITRDVLIISEE